MQARLHVEQDDIVATGTYIAYEEVTPDSVPALHVRSHRQRCPRLRGGVSCPGASHSLPDHPQSLTGKTLLPHEAASDPQHIAPPSRRHRPNVDVSYRAIC